MLCQAPVGHPDSALAAASAVTSPNYFGDGLGGDVVFGAACAAGLEPCGAGVAGGLTSSSSTSKIRVAFAAMSGPTERSPYARFDGTTNCYFHPGFIS